jgi:copper transport protein
VRRALALIAALLLALPAGAQAHAVLVRTVPSASGLVNQAPQTVQLTFSEQVEPRFTSISVTDAAGKQQTTGRPTREGNTLSVPLGKLQEGWFLVYWRVISADGHPVRGAFTFALGPNPGPAPQFVIPSIDETAATPRLVAARWITLLAGMAAIGLFVLRAFIARAVPRVTKAFAAASAVALLATPVYLVLTTAQFSLRSAFDLGDVLPLLDVSKYGRGLLRLELVLALFVFAAATAIWLDRPRRTVAGILANAGAVLAALAVCIVPGTAGHPGTTSPRGLAIALDAVHLSAGSIWLGGLIGLVVLWKGITGRIVARFSNVAIGAVLALIGTGIGASLVHLPTLASLWETGYGQALLVKIALLLIALLLAAVNLLRTRPRLLANKQASTRPIAGEVVLLVGAVFAASVLTSLAPPAKAIADIGKPQATVGPGAVDRTLTRNGYTVRLGVAPNRAAANNRFELRLEKDARPVPGATVTAGFAMLDMEMGRQAYTLPETSPGVYGREAPALVMVGRWGLTLDVQPPGATPFSVTVLDHAEG